VVRIEEDRWRALGCGVAGVYRRRLATYSADSRTPSGSNPAALTDGIAARCSSSLRMVSKWESTASLRCSCAIRRD
jgi:hypothetical protein